MDSGQDRVTMTKEYTLLLLLLCLHFSYCKSITKDTCTLIMHSVSLTAVAQPYLHNGIEGSVCPDTQVSPGHIVTDGGRQHTHWDAKLLIGSASLIQL